MASTHMTGFKSRPHPVQHAAERLKFVIERSLGRPVRRRDLIRLIKPHETVLEIGPLTNPSIRGDQVRYFDVLDREGLLQYAHNANFSPRDSVDIDYVSPTGDLSIVEDQAFDVVFSSHCIEHQPDLVSHLRHVERILKPGGRYLVIAPDHRYCFDHFIPVSTEADVLQAFNEKRTTHSLKSRLQSITMTTHNDARRHWAGDHGEPRGDAAFNQEMRQNIQQSISDGHYVDCHAWQFTPSCFSKIILMLKEKGLITLSPEFIAPTKRNTFEFCGSLKRSV